MRRYIRRRMNIILTRLLILDGIQFEDENEIELIYSSIVVYFSSRSNRSLLHNLRFHPIHPRCLQLVAPTVYDNVINSRVVSNFIRSMPRYITHDFYQSHKWLKVDNQFSGMGYLMCIITNGHLKTLMLHSLRVYSAVDIRYVRFFIPASNEFGLHSRLSKSHWKMKRLFPESFLSMLPF